MNNFWNGALGALASLLALACGFILGKLIRPPLSRWLSGRSESRSHSLYSEIHGLLEVSIRQTAAMVEVRDLLRARPILDMAQITGDIHLDMERIARVVHDLSVSILESLPTDEQRKANTEYMARALANSDKDIALLGQIRDGVQGHDAQFEMVQQRFHALGEIVATATQRIGGEKIAALLEWMQVAHDDSAKQLDALKRIEALQDFSVIQKQGDAHLEALKKLDERLFEFVASTKRIMKAMEGGASDLDDDEIIEEARTIRAKALDRGVELSLEDSIRRAREMRTYQRG